MSPKLKRLSGEEVITILCQFGFFVHSQRGSHVKLRRITDAGEKQTLTVPATRQLDIGTLRAIFRQAVKYLPQDKLRPYFYSE
ncbi:MAG TPA: type II toxin-antitoxin system HicA family toxin [Candidatus Avalokitesvara rifleensis]|uniref:type II toxin-antitoxin system HicA family toxin n=1 Tax=Candidatus Avalokitesvara rifleensis TaxID=3367620 RepID=UPI004026FBBC